VKLVDRDNKILSFICLIMRAAVFSHQDQSSGPESSGLGGGGELHHSKKLLFRPLYPLSQFSQQQKILYLDCHEFTNPYPPKT